jgi:hypothetical protein
MSVTVKLAHSPILFETVADKRKCHSDQNFAEPTLDCQLYQWLYHSNTKSDLALQNK